jgi:REP element-mobilizing transposase RayT
MLAHAVFSTKDRAPLVVGECRERLYPYLGGIAREIGARALKIGGTTDHVHVLLSLPPTLCAADALRDLKANSSRWVHETWPDRGDFAWQTGYGVFSVSESNREAVANYIEGQEAHHRRMTLRMMSGISGPEARRFCRPIRGLNWKRRRGWWGRRLPTAYAVGYCLSPTLWAG